MDRLIEWLPEHIGIAGADSAIVHGDFRLDNLDGASGRAARDRGPRLGALDPGPSTCRLRYHCMAWHIAPGGARARGIGGLDHAALGIPTSELRAPILRTHRSQRSRCGDGGLELYIAYNLFRIAGVLKASPSGWKWELLRAHRRDSPARAPVSSPSSAGRRRSSNQRCLLRSSSVHARDRRHVEVLLRSSSLRRAVRRRASRHGEATHLFGRVPMTSMNLARRVPARPSRGNQMDVDGRAKRRRLHRRHRRDGGSLARADGAGRLIILRVWVVAGRDAEGAVHC